jgi:HTH-type transcriptional regulator, sugar sensing transcriptional regulator
VDITVLQEIGLTDSEIKVYLALLEIGSAKKGPLVKKAGITSSKIYEVVDKLIEKGLASYVLKDNVKYFNAAPPSRIKDYIKEKEMRLKEQEKAFDEILPSLALKQQFVQEGTHTEVYTGWKGMETAYQLMLSVLKKGDTNYVFGASKGEDEEKVRSFFNKHALRLAKKGIKQRIIFNESARGNIQETIRRPQLNEIRHMEHTTPAEINIWADKTMIVILRKKPTVILVSDAKVADSFRKYFDVMWAMAKE